MIKKADKSKLRPHQLFILTLSFSTHQTVFTFEDISAVNADVQTYFLLLAENKFKS